MAVVVPAALPDYTRPMIAPPVFGSLQGHVSRLGDVGLWGPYVNEVLRRHGLAAGQTPMAGAKATYPTFVSGDAVVKLFGVSRGWRQAHAFERAALASVATEPGIAAPRLLGTGRLFEDDAAPWPYLITSRVAGVSSKRAELSADQRLALAKALGRQVRRLHALEPSAGHGRVASQEDWRRLDIAGAALQSALPPHLIAQIDGYLAKLPAFDRVFTHGDLCASHVFVKGDRLAGIIDWGDAMVTDRHYELIQVYRDMFDCDKTLFGAFLAASNWPVDENFATRTLGLALYRQAIGLAQHHTMDVFEPIAAKWPLRDIGTLDELATALFTL